MGRTDRWAKATIDEKIELLRQDIIDIASAQNALAQDFRELGRRMDGLTRASAELVDGR